MLSDRVKQEYLYLSAIDTTSVADPGRMSDFVEAASKIAENKGLSLDIINAPYSADELLSRFIGDGFVTTIAPGKFAVSKDGQDKLRFEESLMSRGF
jgi:hypothetical protein